MQLVDIYPLNMPRKEQGRKKGTQDGNKFNKKKKHMYTQWNQIMKRRNEAEKGYLDGRQPSQ